MKVFRRAIRESDMTFCFRTPFLLESRFVYSLLLFVSLSYLCFASIPVREKRLTQYTHDVWETEDGLPEDAITSIMQSEDGYLWLGTLEGLVRFDGVHFTVFDKSNIAEIYSNRILALYQDRKGNIWFGTEGGGLNKYDGRSFSVFSTRNGLAGNVVSSICEDSRGAIWVATSDGVTRIENASAVSFTTAEGLADDGTHVIRIDPEGNPWVGTEKGVSKWEGGKFVNALPTELGNIGTVSSLVMAMDSTVWVGISHGLIHVVNGTVRRFTIADGMSSDFVWSLFEQHDGSILIGTSGGGLTQYTNGTFVRYSVREGLSNAYVWSVYEDREKDIWVGTNGGGLNRLKDGIFTTYTVQDGLSNNFVWSVCEDVSGDIWIGTYNGLNRLHNGEMKSFGMGDGLMNEFIWSVYPDLSGGVWVGTTIGLQHFDGRTLFGYVPG